MSLTPKNTPALHYKIILLGKTGSGKSASGNTILGEKVFISKKTFKSVTQDVKNETVNFNGVTLHVNDTPGLFNTETSNENVLDKWQLLLQLDETTCTVILLVMKIDIFTLEDKEAVSQIQDFIPERLIQNTWILFTRGDELEKQDLTIDEFIQETEEVNNLVQSFQNRYHVFDNSSQCPNQVQTLIKKIRQTAQITFLEIAPRPDPEDLLHRRIVLVGKTGVGKSATGNTILREERFRSELSSSSITSQCKIQHGVVSGRNVSVIDTPGLFDTTKSPEELAEEIGRSIYESSPGPHAFLYIQPVNIRFTQQEEDVIQKLEQIFGKEMKKYTMILFTHGDQLERKSGDELIQENTSLRRLVDECRGRYHIFNNKHLRNREQVNELLQKIDRIVEENGGTCYSNDMYKEAARLRQARGNHKGFREFWENNKKSLLIAGGVAAGGYLTGIAVGATVGFLVGGPIGAAAGAGIAFGSSLVGSGAIGLSVFRNAKQNNQGSEKTERDNASDSEAESPNLTHMFFDKDSYSKTELDLLIEKKDC